MRDRTLELVENRFKRGDLPEFRVGDTVRVHWKIKEGDKERVQPFEGVVIRRAGAHNRSTYTVRKVSYGVGVERIFPLHSPRCDRIEVVTPGRVRRARLYYLRGLAGKAARVQTQEGTGEGESASSEAASTRAPDAGARSQPSAN